MTHSPLTTSFTSYGGPGNLKRNPRVKKIDMFIVHHAATPSLQAVKNIFAMTGGRGTSAQYIVCDDQIISAVPEEWRAWTGGGKRDGALYDGSTLDQRAITVETVNSGVAKDGWPISAKSFESLARLIEDCSRRYGFPLDRNHVIGHGEMLTRFRAGFATACPGGISVDALVRRAQQIRNGQSKPDPIIPPKTPEEIEEETFMSKLSEFVNELKNIASGISDIRKDLATLTSRMRREARPGLYFVSAGLDGKAYTPDNSPFAAMIHPAGGMIQPLDGPNKDGFRDGETGQVASLRKRYRTIAADASWDGLDESAFFNTIVDVAQGHGMISRDLTKDEALAWARGLYAAPENK